MNKTNIHYCDLTWNPVTGCPGPGPSEGCRNCWAKATARRFGWPMDRITLHRDRLDEPARRRKPAVIAVSFMGDLFHKQALRSVPAVWNAMRAAPQHQYLMLSKRPQNMLFLAWVKPQPDMWLGCTICNQADADRCLPHMARLTEVGWNTWLSLEPLLGPVNLEPWFPLLANAAGKCAVVIGGESGPGARPMHPDWARDIRQECAAVGVDFYFKQWGEWIPDDQADIALGETLAYYSRIGGAFKTINGAKYNRIGTARSGRLLDGVLHDALPWRAEKEG